MNIQTKASRAKQRHLPVTWITSYLHGGISSGLTLSGCLISEQKKKGTSVFFSVVVLLLVFYI
ncbi:(2E,6E)-farnesyl diphosphate synthase [Labeo rohita]|uniref:(2E,6E)-farnesyl diphosphate synthase n=1 Tax=Labeo rohita TaxID=84645 RepID=A0ABQ8LR02_LABRO|nr:(2E,6E)-farnesyl diphosphate synthase [Labeo rohita]